MNDKALKDLLATVRAISQYLKPKDSQKLEVSSPVSIASDDSSLLVRLARC